MGVGIWADEQVGARTITRPVEAPGPAIRPQLPPPRAPSLFLPQLPAPARSRTPPRTLALPAPRIASKLPTPPVVRALPAPARPPRRLAYHPPLDGIRAIAVVAVLLYHGGVAALPGGFLGVDVFFVLSGFLITTLLYREWIHTGRIDLRDFWRRRLRRLAPALLLVLAGVGVYAAVWGDAEQLGPLRWDALASLAYVPNWRFALSGQSYFDQFALPSPLRHTWSLGVEEQWYLLWPIVLGALLFVFRRRLRALGPLLVAGAVGSAVLMALLTSPDTDPSRAYYGTDTRAQALLLGAALALLLRRGRPLGGRRTVQLLGLAGAGGLAWFFAGVTDHTPWMYEGGFLLVALAAGALVVAAVQPRGALVRALAAGPLPGIGRISYGLYLWHWPVFVVLTPARIGLTGSALLAVRLGTTVLLAVASYVLVEDPIRTGRLLARRALPALGLAVLALGGGVLFATRVETREPMELRAVSLLPTFSRADAVVPITPRILIVGDSVGATLHRHFPASRTASRFVVERRVNLGCGITRGKAVLDGRSVLTNPKCERWHGLWTEGVEAFDPDVSLVVLGGWETMDRTVDGRRLRVGTDAYREYLDRELSAGIDTLTSRGGRVALLTTPCFGETAGELGGVGIRRGGPEAIGWFNGIVGDVASRRPETVRVIDLGAFLCPSGAYEAERDGLQMRYDGIHFSQAGADVVWRWLAPQLEAMRPVRGDEPEIPL